MTELDQHTDEFTTTEEHVFAQVQAFKGEEPGMVEKFQAGINRRLEAVADKIDDTQAGDIAEQAVDAVLDILHDQATWSVRQEHIFENFHEEGYSVDSLEDIGTLELDAIEETLDHLERKYGFAAFTEGAVAGSAGLPGVFVDLPAIVTISLRAINEYATYYGFDAGADEERPVAVLILAAAASVGESRQQLFERIAAYTRTLDNPTVAEGEVPDRVMSDVVQQLVTRLVRGKVAESLPLVGALVGGGFNRAFVRHVCETARRVYEERWLMRRYGG